MVIIFRLHALVDLTKLDYFYHVHVWCAHVHNSGCLCVNVDGDSNTGLLQAERLADRESAPVTFSSHFAARVAAV